MKTENHNVVVLGATPKPDRYDNQAIRLLKEKHYHVIPIHPVLKEIESLPVTNSLSDISDTVHTLTLYVGPQRITPMIGGIITLKPNRVIFNPGTESEPLQQALHDINIEWMEACTLVMLKTDQF